MKRGENEKRVLTDNLLWTKKPDMTINGGYDVCYCTMHTCTHNIAMLYFGAMIVFDGKVQIINVNLFVIFIVDAAETNTELSYAM